MEFAEHGTTVAPYVARVIRRYILGAADDSRSSIDIVPTDEAVGPVPGAARPDSMVEDTSSAADTTDTADSADADSGGAR